jgi:hypothetical protein
MYNPLNDKEMKMDKKAEQIRVKIKKLTDQLQKHEERHEKSITKLVKDISKKGIDIRTLAGMVINADNIIMANSKDVGVWQSAGEKFLFKPKDKKPTKKNKSAPNEA